MRRRNSASVSLKTILILLFFVIIMLFIPGTILQYTASFFFILIGASLSYSLIIRSRLVVTRTMSELRSPRFEFLEIKLRIENRSFLPVFSLFIDDKPGLLSISAEAGRAVFHLRRRESIVFTYKVNSNSRGEYFTGPAEIQGCDPLGFFPFVKQSASRCRILVYPAKSDEQFSFSKGIPQGKIPVKNPLYEDTSVYRSVRDYANGDEIKRINWKASARFAKLFTNEYVTTLSSPCLIFLDLDISQYPDHLRYEHAEHAVEAAAQIVKTACAKGQLCGFASSGILPSQRSSPYLSPSSSQLGIILDILALIEPCKKEEKDSILLEKSISSCPSGGSFFYLGPVKKKTDIAIKTKTLRPSLKFFTFFFGEDYE